MAEEQKPCALCQHESEYIPISSNTLALAIKCPNCGTYKIALDLVDTASEKFSQGELALISHVVGSNKERWEKSFLINEEWIKKVIASKKLPNPKVLLDNLILWIGSKLEAYGSQLEFPNLKLLTAELGALNKESLYLIINQAQVKGLLVHVVSVSRGARGDLNIAISGSGLELTYQGWEYYESIQKGKTDSKTAFMAMPFGDEELDKVFVEKSSF